MAEAKVKIGIENSGFERGLAAMRGQITSWKDDIKSTIAGAFTFGAAFSFFNNLREEAGRINDLAARFNQTRQSIQQVSNVAKVSGTDIEQLASILEKMSLSAAEGADAFAKVGINAADFVAADYQGRILMLATAWEQTSGSIQKQADLMDLLGAKGADILPLLSKSVAGLKEEFAAVPTMADDAVQSIARLNDSLETFHTKVQVGMSRMIQWAGFAKDMFMSMWGAKDAHEAGNNLIDRIAAADSAPTTNWQPPAGMVTADKKAEETAKKTTDARAALDQQAQTLARSRMSDAEKLVDLEREKAALAAKAQDATQSEEARLKAAQEVLRVQQEIEATQQRMQKADDAAFEKSIEDEKKTLDLEERAAKMQDEQQLAAMDPAARAEELKKRQKALYDEAAAAEKDNDRRTAAQKRLEAMALADDIAKAQKEAADKAAPEKRKAPSVVSSSLASIGGGGGVYVGVGIDPALQEARNQTNLLRQIAQNTRQTSGTAQALSSSPF